jgi:iron complex outermembrane receptor protein
MFSVNKIAYAVALTVAGIATGSYALAADSSAEANTNAQTAPTTATATAAAAPAKRLAAVVITGARGNQNRTVEKSPAPVDVISEDVVRKANQPNLLETLNTALPSFNVPGLPGYGVNSAVKAGQLRGLNSSHVLVLVNGKRRHATSRLGAGGFAASAPVDLGLIPTGSIERIEVLRDGASAIYGSDAIAGVINIITKKDASGGSVSGRLGEYYEGDGEVQQYIARGGLALGEGGHLFLSAQLDDQKPAFRDSPVPDDVLFYFPLDANGNQILPTGNRSTGPKLPAGATPDPREANIDRDNVVFGASGGVPEAQLLTLTADLALPISDDSLLYGFASFADRDSKSPQHFRFPSRDQVVRALWPDGFTPYSGIKENDYSLQLGVKGSDWLGWIWDLSSVYGNNKIDHYQYDSNSPSYGLASKTDFYIGNYEYDAWTNNLDLRRTLDEGLFGLLTDVSVGAEYRRETYQRGAGEEQSWNHGGQPILDGPNAGQPISISDAGSQADVGVRPEDEADDSRNSYSAYAGISIYPTNEWVVDVAARFEDYSDFGDITTGRLSTRYDFTDSFALRGTISNGFQAPALAAQTYRNTNPTVEYTTHTLAVDSPEAQALGAKLLQPEESVSYTLGLVANPFGNAKLAVDVYQIYVDNRISQLSTFREATHPGAGALVQAASPRFGADDAISYLINAGDTKTEGVDVTLEGVYNTEAGFLRWTLAANYNETSLENVAPTPGVLSQFNIPLYSAASQVNLLYLAPRFKGIIGLEWNAQNWNVGINATRYGEIRRSTTVAGSAEPVIFSVGDLWLVDLEVGYQISQQLRFGVSVNNLFDEKPPRLPEGSTALWPFQSYSYVNNGPVNASGGFYSAKLTYSW